MKLFVYIAATVATLFLAISTGNFFAWWLFVSVFLSPPILGMLKVASDADDALGYN